MKKFDNLQAAIHNLKDIYSYQEPYGNVEMTGMVGLYEICFEQAWKAMKEILTYHGYAEGATGSPRTVLKTAYKAGHQEIMLHMHIIRQSHWILYVRLKQNTTICLKN